jgi:WD40 repeat protein
MHRGEYRLCLMCAMALGILALLMALAQPPTAKAQPPKPISFIHDIAPIFKENCLACHDAKKKSGKLDMSTYAQLRKGGANDDPIAPGKPDESDLVRLIVSQEEDRMPPPDKGMPLSSDKVQLIRQWIKEGAKLDDSIDANADLLREVRKRWHPPLAPETYPAPTAATAMAFVPGQPQLVVGGYHELIVWNLEDQKIVQRLRTRAERTYAMAFLPNGWLAVAGGRPGQEGDVRVYDLNGPSELKNGVQRLDGVRDPRVLKAHLFDADDCVLALAVHENQLAAGGCDRIVRVWDISDLTQPKLTHTIANHADWVLGLAFTPDGQRLLTASRDKTAKLFDLAKQETIATIPDHQAAVHGVAVRSDGSTAYSVGADRMLWSWTLTPDKMTKKRSTGHGAEVTNVLPHASAPYVFTASADKSVRIWRADGNPFKTLTLPEAACSLAVSPDGRQLAAGCVNGEVVVWQLPEGKPLAEFQATPIAASR